MIFMSSPLSGSVGRERQESDVARALDRGHQASLVHRAGPRDAAWQDLAPLRNETLQQPHVLVVDVLDLLVAELAELATLEDELLLEAAALLAAAVSPAAAVAIVPS